MALIDFLGSDQVFYNLYGSFWRLFLEDASVVQDLAQATSLLTAQLERRSTESDLLIGFQSAQNYRLRFWKPLIFRESELDNTTNVVSWGSGHVWGDGLLWGQVQQDAATFAIPTEIKVIGFMTNDLAKPTHTLAPGVDYVLDADNAKLTFRFNPFDNPNIEVRDVFEGGAQVDREVVIWAISVGEHDGSVYDRHGAILQLLDAGESTYAAATSIAYETLLQGPSDGAIVRGLHAVAGLRVAEGDETVLVIDSVSQSTLLIITDKNVYRFHIDAIPTVVVGDVLEEGDVLTDTVIVESLGGNNPDLSAIPALVLNQDTANVTGPIGLANEEVAITNVVFSGVLDIEFPVQGTYADVSRFWFDIHTRGIANGRTLRDIVLEWKGTLNTTINPTELIAGHLLDNNAVIIALKPEHFLLRGSMGAKLSAVVARYLPPRMLALQYMFLTPTVDTYIPDGAADEVALYGAIDTIDTAGAGLVDLTPVLRQYPV